MGDAVSRLHETPDGVDLILHQGDERRDDDGRPFHDEGGQLIAEGFAASGGHQHKRVAPVDEMPDDSFLVTLEGIETEELFQFRLKD